MQNSKKIALIGLVLLSLLIIISAVSLHVFVPDFRQKGLIAGIMLLLCLPALAAWVMFGKAMSVVTEAVKELKTRDSLTNLYNQKTFWDFLGYEVARSKRHQHRFSLMIADVDNFNAISEIYGHEAGNACLCELSRLLKLSVRSGDFAARYGEDEFAAILPICDEVQSYIVAKRFLDSVRDHPFVLPDGTTLQITASIGMAVYPDHGVEGESLFLLAHTMLQQAKSSGKDRMKLPGEGVSIDNLKSSGETYIFIMDAIRNKQVVPFFQPIVSTADRSILAYEVLTRIVTPTRIIPASDFVEAAEEMGAIGKIDYQLMEQAFQMTKKSGYRGMLFFNLSPKALIINEFIPSVWKLMNLYDIGPAQVVFEITERDTVKNLTLIEKTMQELKLQGFKFAIDDFGKGYSSFEYIKLFKVDFLKIDGDFIRNLNTGHGIEQIIVKNIVDIAGFLGIKTIAEYVESESVFTTVNRAGIDFAQGFHIQRPMPDFKPGLSAVQEKEAALLSG